MADLRARLQAALADRYTIERELGRGGMAIVFLARDRRHDRDVAVKVLRPELAASLGPERFLREIKVAAGLTHPHIVPLHDSGEAGGLLYYVMPFIQGESLRDKLEREGTLAVAVAVQLAREVAHALDYAHRQSVVHRDIKPENILIQDGHAVVADFGIARAISAAGGHRVTATGIAVGTPDYMSPEQAQGEDQVDGRSDIYSLGCVLYEMLTGEAPFVGTTPQEVMRKQLGDTPVSGRIPAVLHRILQRAMAKSPANRYQSASEFAAALGRPSLPVARLLGMPRRWLAGLVTAAALGGAAVTVLPRVFLGARLDRSLYAVVPFGHPGGAAPALLNGDQCELLLNDAFGRWTDVRVVGGFRVDDERLRRGNRPTTIREALDIARVLGSGRLVWGTVGEFGDSIRVRAALYDVASGDMVREHWVHLSKDLHELGPRFNELADSLLLNLQSRTAAPGAVGTNRLAAWRAYQAGDSALGVWDLPAAARAFRTAVDTDPQYPHANLWLAQVEDWLGEAPRVWRSSALAALASPIPLGPPDRARAEALLAMADGRFDQACARYRQLLARDSLDFTAWYGLGECHAKDPVVVRDVASPSGWSFRGSYHAGLAAYGRALRLLPSVHLAFRGGPAFNHLAEWFFAETDEFRLGHALASDTLRLAAFPSWEHDTLAFVPHPLGEVLAGSGPTIPPTWYAAVQHNRDALVGVTTAWLHAFPNNADALEQHGLALETTGKLISAGSEDASALATVRRARRVSEEIIQTLRLAVSEVRLLVKLDSLGHARRQADSLLRIWRTPSPPPEAAAYLAGLAALTGHIHRAAELWRSAWRDSVVIASDGSAVQAPPEIMDAALPLLVYSSLGAPPDSIVLLERRVESRVKGYVAPTRRRAVGQAVLDQPAMLAFPDIGVRSVHRARAGAYYLIEMQWALAHGDTATVRTALARKRAERQGAAPGQISIDYTYQEARLLLALGDTAAAIEHIDHPLVALPSLGTVLLWWVTQPGGLVRAMALRAELAARARDAATAQRWARAVLALWSDADVELRPTVERMRTLAGPAQRRN
jgi:tetratricopeptide (TPR) repeat protein